CLWRNIMTAEEIVMNGYAAFGSGDMEALGKIYHPECKTTFHANHALGGEYIGFQDLLTNMLARLNDAWPGFDLSVDNVVSNDTDVCVFCTFTADGGLSGKGVHHFVVEDGLEVSFDLYWDSGYWAAHCKI
ncbi:MAG: nuclear transport factor 2 family protein, partial [Amylibacter sp.]|nr:nuclear transport factor 2 family protein [Amylibacter sp.]